MAASHGRVRTAKSKEKRAQEAEQVIRIRVRDETFDFAPDSITLNEMYALKEKCQMTVVDFQDAVNRYDPDALNFLVWLVYRRSGKDTDFNAVEFSISDFDMEDVTGENPTVPASTSGEPETPT